MIWVVPEQWKDLNPPAEVRVYGDLPRSAEKLLLATRVLKVKSSKRYQPVTVPRPGKLPPVAVTFCNIYTADVFNILRAPLPHWFDLGDGKGRREMRANDYADGLRAGKFPGWEPLSVLASGQLAAANNAALGLPTVAVWKNPTGGPGHITPVVPTPEGKTGVYVSGAGRACVEECPLAEAYGKYTPEVEFFGFRDSP